jgi:hypothetical protein
MGRPTFRTYAVNIEAKTGNSLDDFWQLAGKKGFVKGREVVAKHAELLEWFKSDIRLGHVQASFVILYLQLRGKDPKVSVQMRTWAHSTGDIEVEGG